MDDHEPLVNMKNDSSHPPLAPLWQKGGEADHVGAHAVCKTESQTSIDAEDRNTLSRTLVHDLRNAVAPIRNAVQLLRFRDGGDPPLAPVIDMIERQVNEIVRLLNVLADADRVGSGDLKSAVDNIDRKTPPRAAATIGKHILIVDDNAELLTSLSSALRDGGHQVKTSADGAEALALAQSWRPEFVLVDVHMPGMNGYEVARQLRSLFPRGAMKLVLMSGSTLDEATRRGAEQAGFDHCLDKIHDLLALEELLCNEA